MRITARMVRPTLRTTRRPSVVMVLCGLALAAFALGGAEDAAAFGGFGFGHFGGFSGGGGGMRGYGGGARAFATMPRPGNGRIYVPPPGGYRGGIPTRGGPGWRHPIIVPGPVIGATPVPPVSTVPNGPPPGGGNIAGRGGGGGGTVGNMPPPGERRFVPDEVITAFAPSVTPAAIEQLARRHNLTRLESQSFSLTGTTIYRWRIGGRRPVGDLIGRLEDERIVSRVQPNYLFTMQEDAARVSADKTSVNTSTPTVDYSAQYVLGKLQVAEAHRVATGKSILVALIDSEVDAKNPDLDTTIAKSFDAIGGEDKPHLHGTAMAGAIVAHVKLMGIAPGAQLLAARAFDDGRDAKGTSFAIYKALQWAADNGARVVNMSFAGPQDPTMHQMLAAAYEKGMVLIAASGNAGPASPPLYPAADPSVIAVTATDAGDGLFTMANRGPYIAIATPGVDVLALAPGGALQLTTGTSVATAHVSGLAALLLECKPSLKPADVRAMLASTAKPLGFGAGLVNAYRAVTSLNAEASGKDAEAPGKEDGEPAKQ